MAKDCFDIIKDHAELSKEFKDLDETAMRELASKQYQKVHDDILQFKKANGLKATPSIAVDKAKDIEAVKSTYQNKIDELKKSIPEKQTVVIDEPNKSGESKGKDVQKLTKEAEDLLASVGEGSMPTFITKNLERIATENGVEITGKMTAVDVINALKEIQSKGKDVVVDEGVVDNGLSEGANKILGLHDNGVNFDLFDNNKLREIAKENGIDLPEGAKNADIIEALKNKRNELANKKNETQDVNESIGTEDNTETILATAEKKGGIYAQLAKAVKNLLGGVKTTVYKNLSDFAKHIEEEVSTHGAYDESNKTIHINNATDKNKLHIFFHEALHHITIAKIKEFEKNPNSKNLTPSEFEAILNLKRIYKQISEKVNRDRGGFGKQSIENSPTNLWMLGDRGTDRGFANVHEFISEAFTNPEFQKILSQFKGEGKEPNLFKQFVNAVAKMLGLKDPTILDDIFHHTEKLIDKEQSLSTKPEIKNEKQATEIPNPKEEGSTTIPTDGESIPKTEERTYTKNALDRADAKKIYQQVREVDKPVDAAQVALEYIANGGKISEAAINEVAGRVKRASLNTGAREKRSTEYNARDYSSKTNETLDQLAHNLWELNDQKISEIEIKDALMDAIGSHNTRLEAGKAYLERYSPEYAEKQQQEKFYQEHIAEIEAEEKAINDYLNSEKEIEIEAFADENFVTKLIEKYEAESKGENQQSTSKTESSTNKGTGSTTGNEGNGKEPPKGEEPVGEGDNAGITHAANEVRRQDRNLPEYEKSPETFEQWNNEAEKLIKEGYDVEGLMDKMEKDKYDPNPVENAIRKIYIATLDAQIEKNPTDALLAKQKRFIQIGDAANSRAGRNLVSLKGEGSPLSSISDFYVAKMEAAGVDKLTEQQKKETKEAYDNVQKADENAQAAMEVYRAEIAKLKAENELLKQKKASTPKSNTPKTKDDFVSERKTLKDKLKQQFEDYKNSINKMGVVSDGGVEGFVITAKMAKTIGEIAKSYVDEIGVNLKEVTKRTFEEIKDLIVGISEKDIHDVLAGEYKQKLPTRDELAAKMRDLKDEAYYINKLDKLVSGKEPKVEKEKVKRNQQITELQKKIKDFQKEQPLTDAELKAKLKAIKTRNENEAVKLKERINKGDFEAKKPLPFLEDPEMQRKFPKEYKAALDAIVAREDARHEFDIALMKDQLAKRNLGKKSIDLVGDVIGTTKALVTGIDASGIGIQNLVAMISHPRSAAVALPASFGDFASAKRQERWLASVHNSKLFPLAQKAKLDITEPKSLKSSEKEEIFTHNLLDKKIKYKGKTYIISKYLTKPFERIFTGLGNRMRWNLWTRGVEKLYEEGYTWESHPEEFKSLAKVLNTETGRGTLHPTVDKAFDFISAGIWSPRLMASRMNILGIGDLGNLIAGGKRGYYGGLTPRMRAYALKDFAKFVMFGAGVMGLAGLTFADDVDFDPNSSTFGTMSVDGKRYNIWGGFTQYVRLVAKLISGGEKNKGEFTESSQLKTLGRFMWSKTTPAVGTGLGLLSKGQRDYMGQPITGGGVAESLTIPLSIRGLVKGVQEEGAGSLLWTALPSFVGLNVSYESEFKDRGGNWDNDVKESAPFKILTDNEVKLPEVPDNKKNMVIEDDNHPEGKMTEEEYKTFTEEWKKEVKKGVDELYNKGRIKTTTKIDKGGNVVSESNPSKVSMSDLDKDNLEKELSSIKSEATEIAKKKAVKQSKTITTYEKRD